MRFISWLTIIHLHLCQRKKKNEEAENRNLSNGQIHGAFFHSQFVVQFCESWFFIIIMKNQINIDLIDDCWWLTVIVNPFRTFLLLFFFRCFGTSVCVGFNLLLELMSANKMNAYQSIPLSRNSKHDIFFFSVGTVLSHLFVFFFFTFYFNILFFFHFGLDSQDRHSQKSKGKKNLKASCFTVSVWNSIASITHLKCLEYQ